MIKSRIDFKLENLNKKEKTIDINLEINNIENKKVRLYKGNMKLLHIKSLENIKEENNEIIINCTNNKVKLKYTVQIAGLGKHGQNGEINNDLIVFTGSQILLLPTNVLNGNDIELEKSLSEINISYPNDLNNKCSAVPYKQVINKNIVSNINTIKWHNVYDLMKSCYAFCEFENISIDENKNILIEKNQGKINNETIEAISSLCNYYETLFDYKINNLQIILLSKNKENNEYILGGAGRNIIGATFDVNNTRDWQLLSHRLFHAYMDSAVTIRQMHIAPQLWITEGLATYYENLALESLNKKLKDKLGINFNKEISKIYRRYIYIRIKDNNRLAISPIEEGQIYSHGKMEFLHYTQAPLIIKMIEDLNCEQNDKNSIIKYLKNINEHSFNLKSMFDYALKNYCDEFAYKYIFNSSLIPLWNLSTCNTEKEDVIKELNEYEELLWSWFVIEDNYYTKEVIVDENIDKLVAIANMGNLKFEDTIIENKIKEFNSTLYNLLKVYILRAKVCKISLKDINIRYKLYGDINNKKLWKSYIR
ncbi:MAG: hypothetical protein ACRDA3_03070 [Peptostreptococcaceae bacterium]